MAQIYHAKDTVNQIFIRVREIFVWLARASLSQIFLATKPVLVISLGLNKVSSLTLVIANQFI